MMKTCLELRGPTEEKSSPFPLFKAILHTEVRNTQSFFGLCAHGFSFHYYNWISELQEREKERER